MSKEAVNKIIKSCIVSRKGGVPLNEIENDYRELVGQSIPYAGLGYKSLRDLIASIDYIKVKTNFLGEFILSVSDPKVAHIESLVSKQKNPSNRYASSKQHRNNRYAKKHQANKFATEYNTGSVRRYEKRSNTDNYRPDKFYKNTRMEYTQSKWYSDRPKDSWTKKRYESRQLDRFNNFNARRPSMQSHSNNSSVRNDNSWSGKSGSPSSVEENLYNFHSEEERRYAQESRSWRFQVQVADNRNSNSTVGSSRYGPYNNLQPPNPFVHGQPGGGPYNNYNYGWREWGPNRYYGSGFRDNQSGLWWPGLRGPSNAQFPWMGMQYPEQVVLEPLIKGHQLIGDDFFLQLAMVNFRAEPRKPRANSGLECGLCISGQTINECRQRLEKMEFLSGSIAILLGAVDIFRGHSLDRMVNDMKKLLDVCRNRFNVSKITLCTIPPLANYSVRFNLPKLSVLYSFNNWIKLHSNFGPDDSYVHHYNVIDLFSRFTDGSHRTLYDYFQINARMVSGCSYPHVLWNGRGRRTVISMLEKY